MSRQLLEPGCSSSFSQRYACTPLGHSSALTSGEKVETADFSLDSPHWEKEQFPARKHRRRGDPHNLAGGRFQPKIVGKRALRSQVCTPRMDPRNCIVYIPVPSSPVGVTAHTVGTVEPILELLPHGSRPGLPLSLIKEYLN